MRENKSLSASSFACIKRDVFWFPEVAAHYSTSIYMFLAQRTTKLPSTPPHLFRIVNPEANMSCLETLFTALKVLIKPLNTSKTNYLDKTFVMLGRFYAYLIVDYP